MVTSPTLSVHAAGGLFFLVDEAARSRGLLVAFADRHGGISVPPFDSLNLAARVGDDPAAVAENRERVARALGRRSEEFVYSRQVHGTRVVDVDTRARGMVGEADGLFTQEPGCVLTMLTADCAPVVVAGAGGVAILHAGWRGLAAGVIEAGLGRIGTPATAWIGPSIRACCYEVGPEVVTAFEARGLPIAAPNRVDPPEAAAALLANAGVDPIIASPCTSCDPAYFSYRRDGVTGRQGAFVGLLE